MSFRSESFLRFVFKTKLPFFFGWVLNAGVVSLLILYFILGHKDNPSVFLNTLAFIVPFFVIIKLFAYVFAFYRYKMGKKAYDELGREEKKIFTDIKIHIKGFDLFEIKKFFPPNLLAPTYEFSKADVIITKQCLVLLGKIDWYGGIWYESGIEIAVDLRKTSLPSVTVTDLSIKDRGFEIEINDPNFKKSFRLDFKEEREMFDLWLVENEIKIKSARKESLQSRQLNYPEKRNENEF
jgi:hypothetical protein